MNTAKQQRNTPSRDADTELGRRAHMLIWDSKLKQGEVATRIGMSSGSLGLKLKGQRGWALDEIVALAAALNTTVAYLAGETEDPRPVGPRPVNDRKTFANAVITNINDWRKTA